MFSRKLRSTSWTVNAVLFTFFFVSTTAAAQPADPPALRHAVTPCDGGQDCAVEQQPAPAPPADPNRSVMDDRRERCLKDANFRNTWTVTLPDGSVAQGCASYIAPPPAQINFPEETPLHEEPGFWIGLVAGLAVVAVGGYFLANAQVHTH